MYLLSQLFKNTQKKRENIMKKHPINLALEYYGNDLVSLRDDYDASSGYSMVSGGCFAISYADQRKDLLELGYGVDHLDDDHIYELYCDIMVEALDNFLG